MFVDFVLNGEGQGPVGSVMNQVRFDSGLLRPYIDEKGRGCVTVNSGRTKYDPEKGIDVPEYEKVRIVDLIGSGVPGVERLILNSATLRKGDWIRMDQRVNQIARLRLRAWADLYNASPYGGFDGMSTSTIEYETMTDPGEAMVDMDGLSEANTDSPLFKLRSMPLPITHSGFHFSERRLATSRNSSTPLDLVMLDSCTRRVIEKVEKTLIGVDTGMTYGTQTAGYGTHDGSSTVYGYTNFPYRMTKTDLTTPTGANPEAILSDVLEMIETMQSNGFVGPYVLYHSTPYSRFFNDDYFRSGSTSAVRSLRERLMQTEDVTSIRRLDYLTSGYQLILMQLTPDVAQAVNGMDIKVVSWKSMGEMKVNYRVMCMYAPLLRADSNGVTAILHGTTS